MRRLFLTSTFLFLNIPLIAMAQTNQNSPEHVQTTTEEQAYRTELPRDQEASQVDPILDGPAGNSAPETAEVNPPRDDVTIKIEMSEISEPIYPRDLSVRYSMVDRGVPIIQNPGLCSEEGPDLRITVNNIEKSEGTIVADLHNDIVEDFLQWDKVVLRIRTKAQEGSLSFCLPLPEPGTFAVAVYHDKNDNWKFDKGFLRIPREKFGMSNNPVFGLSTPDFEEVAIMVPETGMDLDINLISSGDILRGNRP